MGARAGSVVAHDRGDSVALTFAARCASGESPFELGHLVLSNGNMFLRCRTSRSSSGSCSIPPPRRRCSRRRRPRCWRPGWARTRSPRRVRWRTRRSPRWRRRSRYNEGIAVAPRHDPIPRRALRARGGVARGARRIAGSDDARLGAVRHRLAAAGRGVHLEHVPGHQAGRQRVLAPSAREPLPPARSAAGVRRGRDARSLGSISRGAGPALRRRPERRSWWTARGAKLP